MTRYPDLPLDPTSAARLAAEATLDRAAHEATALHLPPVPTATSALASPASPADPATADAPHATGEVLAGRYRIEALLGQGAMGYVYRGSHILMKKPVAIKVLRRELVSVAELQTRFEREAMASANIQHENVAAATDFGKLEDGSSFLVMEFVEGRSLRSVIEAGPLPLERALRIVYQIASALVAAHALGIVHRDLKPENVMLVTRGRDTDFVKVLDFGIARVPEDDASRAQQPNAKQLTRAGLVFGTPDYMAPEQALGQQVDARADLYALGVVAFELLAGCRPFDSASPQAVLGQQLAGPPPRPSQRNPAVTVPSTVEALLGELLAVDAKLRLASADELVERVATLLGASGGSRASIVGRAPTQHSLSGVGSFSARDAGGALVARSRAVAARLRPLLSRVDWQRRVDWHRLSRGPVALVERVRPKLPRRLRVLPAPALLGATATLLVALVVVLVWTLGARSHPSRAATARKPVLSLGTKSEADPGADRGPGNAPVARIAEAADKGLDALEGLAKLYPKDAAIEVAIGKVAAADGQASIALGAVERALELDPQPELMDEIADVLKATTKDVVTAKTSIRLLMERLGSKGREIIWLLSQDADLDHETRQLVHGWLVTKEFREGASAGTAIAVRLYYARDCYNRKNILDSVREQGDELVLPLLEQYSTGGGCGPHDRRRGKGDKDDCNGCLIGDPELKATIDAVRRHVEVAREHAP